MFADWPLTFGAGLALLALGGLGGRLWAQAGGRRDRGGGHRDRPHFLQGLNYLVSNQPDLAISELSAAVRSETDTVEAYLALGNLFREMGQAERAIDIHKSLLHRSALSTSARAQVLFSLGMDFKKAGLIDRAERTLSEVLQNDPTNVGCLHSLREIYEEMSKWDRAVEVQRQIDLLPGRFADPLLASIEYESGRASWKQGDSETAARLFESALAHQPDYAPGRLGLADCLLAKGDEQAAAAHLEQALEAGSPWALVALERLADACERLQDDKRLEAACELVLQRDPRAWRARLVEGRLLQRRGDLDAARSALEAALRERPGSLAVQRSLWEVMQLSGAGLDDFIALADGVLDDEPLVDPFVCLRCRFESTELSARCPHCHHWNSMAEERQ